MATYVNLEVINEHVNCLVIYPSEPILVEASAYLTSNWNINEHAMSRTALLVKVRNSINSKSIVNVYKGDVGELMASTLICFTLERIRELNEISRSPIYDGGFMSTDVKVSDFIKSLYPNINKDEEHQLLSLIEGNVTNVTHFIRLPFTPKSNKLVCNINIKRGAAIITKENSPTVDLYLSFFKSSSSISSSSSSSSLSSELIHWRVQVKNVSQKISHSEALTLLSTITDKSFPSEELTIQIILQVKYVLIY